MIERKQKGTVARRKEKVRGGGRKPREAHSDLGGCRISWPFSLFFSTCRSFFVRCLQSFPGRYPAQGSCRGSCPDSPATVRYHTYTASLFCLPQVFSYVYLVVSLPPPPPSPLLTCSRRRSLLFSRLHTTVCAVALLRRRRWRRR